MPRSNPPGINLAYCESHVAMRLELTDGNVYRLASAKIMAVDEAEIGGGPYNYLGHIMKDSAIKQSILRTADAAGVDAQNVDRALGLTINEVAHTLTGAQVALSKVFRNDGSTAAWERKVLFNGEIADAQINENVVELKIVSDTAPNVAFISNRPIQKHCPLIFKGEACGYTGPLTTCNKLYTDPGGCSGRNNQHRFGGVVIGGELGRIITIGDWNTDYEDRLNSIRQWRWYPYDIERIRVPEYSSN